MGSTALEAGLLVESRYRLEHWLGSGGMGVVWAATNLKTSQNVALKFLRPELAVELRTHQRFLREARAAASVRHPNVVAVHEVLENDGFPAIVMDLLLGETLAKRLASAGALTAHETAALLAPVVSAIGTAHTCGVVHRDLKPDNVFICSGNTNLSVRVRVLDFGIAKLLQREPGVASTQTGTLIGSPLYMSPEQVFCEGDIDHRADAWSLGIILYECLAGVRPTAAASVGQTLKIITTGGIRPLAQSAVDVPAELAELVDALLSRDRARRPELTVVHSRLRRYAPEDDSPTFLPPPSRAALAGGSGSSYTLVSTLVSAISTRADGIASTLLRARRPRQREPKEPTPAAWRADAVAIGAPARRRHLVILGLFVGATAGAWVVVRTALDARTLHSQLDAASSAERAVGAPFVGDAGRPVISRRSAPATDLRSSQPAFATASAVAARTRPSRAQPLSSGGSDRGSSTAAAPSAPVAAPNPSTRVRGALVEAPPF